MGLRPKEVFAAALKATGMTQAEVARLIGMPEQSIGQMINIRESIRADLFLQLLEVMGIETLFYRKDTGEVLMKDISRGKRVVGMSDGVVYDTKESKIIASSFFADGENEFGPDGKAQELYIDRQGRYFVAEFSNNEGERDRVRSVPANMATAFINQYKAKDITPV